MPDPLMDLTDDLVAALAAGAFSLPFTPQWKDDALAELADAELLAPQVWAVDVAESLLPASGAGVPLEEFGVLLVVQQKLTEKDDRPAVCRALSALVSELARFCRTTVIQGAVCVKTVRSPARNLKDYHETWRFYAEIQTTWHRVLDRQ